MALPTTVAVAGGLWSVGNPDQSTLGAWELVERAEEPSQAACGEAGTRVVRLKNPLPFRPRQRHKRGKRGRQQPCLVIASSTAKLSYISLRMSSPTATYYRGGVFDVTYAEILSFGAMPGILERGRRQAFVLQVPSQFA